MDVAQDAQREATGAGAPHGERAKPKDWRLPLASGVVQTRAIPIRNCKISKKDSPVCKD